MKNLLSVDEVIDKVSSYKGIIFDLDGTLLDSMQMWAELDVKYLARFDAVIYENFHEDMKSMTIPMASAFMKEKFNIPFSPEEIARQIMEMADDSYRYELPLKEKAGYVVKRLHELGLEIMVATANEYELVKTVVKRTGITEYVKDCITCGMVGANKEKPDIYNKACEIMGVSINQCVVFEDSLYAIETAKKAGYFVVGVYDKAEESNWDKICELSDCQVVL